MSSTKSAKLEPTMTAPWTRPEPLPDVPGGEPNLLHRSAWSDPLNPLRVEFKPWYDSPPDGDDWTERVDVFLDDDESNIIGSDQWTLPMGEDEYFVEISADRLPPGQHTLSFIMTNYVGVAARSFPFTVTIDKTPPGLNQTDEKLIFPVEIIRDGVTAAYLARPENNDQVRATIPLYFEAKPGDVIRWYLNTGGGTGDAVQIEVGSTTLPYPVPESLEAVFTGQAFRDHGDIPGYARYRIWDRAGNRSELSERVELDVLAAPTPRDLSYPRVLEATGTPAEGRLDPNPATIVLNGINVEIPQNAIIADGETVAVLFGEPGTFGFYRAQAPSTAGGRIYRIPKEYVARNLRKTIPVSFEVTVPGQPDALPSLEYSLTLSSLTGLPTIQCDKVTNNTLRLSNISDGGVATFTQSSWKYMSTSQFLRVTVKGMLTGGGEETVTVLDAGSVPASGTVAGGTISKTTLQRFMRGETLDIRSYVSFDDKQTWHDFPYITPMLAE